LDITVNKAEIATFRRETGAILGQSRLVVRYFDFLCSVGCPRSGQSAVGPLKSLRPSVSLTATDGQRRFEMGIAQYDRNPLALPSWNAGRKVGVEKPLKQRQMAVRFFLDREGRIGDRRYCCPSRG
jgi:hypothetical protein